MFLVDTNFLGTAETLYPEDVFPTFWRELERTLFTGDVFFHSSVDTELKKWSHPRLNWYLKNVDQPKQILHPDGDEINAYREVTEWLSRGHGVGRQSPDVQSFGCNDLP